jgi:hypothetical protein
VLIRREVPADVDEIDEVHRLAFAATADGGDPLRSVWFTLCAPTGSAAGSTPA